MYVTEMFWNGIPVSFTFTPFLDTSRRWPGCHERHNDIIAARQVRDEVLAQDLRGGARSRERPLRTCQHVRKLFTLYLTLKISSCLLFSIAIHPSSKCYASGGEDGFVRVHHFDESYFKAKPYGDLEIED